MASVPNVHFQAVRQTNAFSIVTIYTCIFVHNSIVIYLCIEYTRARKTPKHEFCALQRTTAALASVAAASAAATWSLSLLRMLLLLFADLASAGASPAAAAAAVSVAALRSHLYDVFLQSTKGAFSWATKAALRSWPLWRIYLPFVFGKNSTTCSVFV